MERRRDLVLGGLIAVALAVFAGVVFAQSEPDRHPDLSLTPVADENGHTIGYIRPGSIITSTDPQDANDTPIARTEMLYDKYGTPIGTLPSTPGTIGH